MAVELDGKDVFNASGCISISEAKKSDTVILRKGSEFCDDNGTLVGVIKTLQDNGYISWDLPGLGWSQCNLHDRCELRWFGARKYYSYERLGEDDKGLVALFRVQKE